MRASGADYSVPPGLVGRRVQIQHLLTQALIFLEGRLLARHTRSYVPADVVIDPEHARALRAARGAKGRLASGDVHLDLPDLARYDALLRVTL